MEARCMLRVIAASAVITAAGLYCPEPLRGVIGISTANAKEFYTRKRVNGRWVTGRFARHHTRQPLKAKINARAIQAAPAPTVALAVPASIASLSPVGQSVPVPPMEKPVSAAAPEDSHLADLKQALQARASKLATGAVERPTTTGSIGPAREPRSIHFDFQRRVKTTAYTDGRWVEEPFDPALEQWFGPPTR